MKQKYCICVGLFSVCALFSVAHAQSSGRIALQDEPIVLPKMEAGRVTARLNATNAPNIGNAALAASETISAQRIGGVTTIRVSPEIGLPYVLSNGSVGNVLRAREHDSFRVPQWQIGKF